MYWECHTSIYLNLREDGTYSFKLLDDVSSEKTEGTYENSDSVIVLKPNIIPDTIQVAKFECALTNSIIEYWFDKKDDIPKVKSWNLIVVNNYFKPLICTRVEILVNNVWETKETDERGRVIYTGQIADSIKFRFYNRNIKIKLDNIKSSFVRITVKDSYQDLIYRSLGRNTIQVKNGKMFLNLKEEGRKLEKIYFLIK